MSAALSDEELAVDDIDFIKSDLTHFVDLDYVMEVIQLFCHPSWHQAWKDRWEGLVTVVSKYQEQPTLLNPHLEAMVSPLCTRLLELMHRFGVFEGSFTDEQYMVGTIILRAA